jgi:hypothetical protein
MSKLIFPEHGGMLVDDDARVVKTVRHKDRDGTYTIKIAATRDPIDPRHRRYQWHYLSAGGVASTSGYRSTIAESVESAIRSIKEQIRRHRQGLAEARKTPSQKAQDRLKKRAKFFKEASGSKDAASAMRLAQAEQYAEEQGWKVEWDYDQDKYQLGDAETEMPNEVLCAVLKDADGHALESLGGIGDPSPSYRRLVEAELALEAMPSALLPAKTY